MLTENQQDKLIELNKKQFKEKIDIFSDIKVSPQDALTNVIFMALSDILSIIIVTSDKEKLEENLDHIFEALTLQWNKMRKDYIENFPFHPTH